MRRFPALEFEYTTLTHKKTSIPTKVSTLVFGGEGLSPITATNENEAFPPEIQPIHKIFSYIVFPIKRENLKLFRL